jgi:hypothetical protein
MANNYGDITTFQDKGKTRHITISATECLCGYKWSYGTIDRNGESNNITWRNIESVTCEKCKELHLADPKKY